MNTLNLSFSYITVNKPVKEDTHFKTITVLKSNTDSNFLTDLYFNLVNKRIEWRKSCIDNILKEHINTHFSNRRLNLDIEEHLIKHNNSYIIMSVDTIDNSICIKNIIYRENVLSIEPLSDLNLSIQRENFDFYTQSDNTNLMKSRTKKKLIPGLFNIFKSHKKESI